MNRSTLVLTFQQAVEGFLLDLHAEGYSQSTIDIYKWGLNKFKPHIPIKLIDISKNDLLITYSALRSEELKPASIQNVWIAMRTFFAWSSKKFGLNRIDLDIPCPRVTPPAIVPGLMFS